MIIECMSDILWTILHVHPVIIVTVGWSNGSCMFCFLSVMWCDVMWCVCGLTASWVRKKCGYQGRSMWKPVFDSLHNICCVVMWLYLIWIGSIWFDFYNYIISYHIISYHIILYYITSYHITSYHIISHHIISHHIILNHIIA